MFASLLEGIEGGLIVRRHQPAVDHFRDRGLGAALERLLELVRVLRPREADDLVAFEPEADYAELRADSGRHVSTEIDALLAERLL